MANIAVIGAGVVGLSTAINIQKVIPGSNVKVISEKFDADTTSSGCGGIFLPSLPAHPGTPGHLLKKWAQNSWTFYQQLVTGPEAGKCGGVILTGYRLGKTEYEDPLYKDIVFSYRKLTDVELNKLGFSAVYKHGYQVTTLVLNQTKYLKWLMKRFVQNGGEFERRKINNLEEVKAPWIKHWLYTDDLAYVIPREDLIGLGGLKDVGNGSTNEDPDITRQILEKCEKVSPNIKYATVDHSWIGLRPGRDSVRLEAETINFARGQLKVVHNYGHGSNGVALSWGTSIDAAELVVGLLSKHLAKL